MTLKVGDKLPSIYLYNSNKERKNLEDMIKGKTIIAFLPGAYTDVCTEEICKLESHLADLEQLQSNVIGITTDSPYVLHEWGSINQITFPLMSYFDKTCIQKFGSEFQNLGGLEGYICANRSIYVVDSKKTITYVWHAPNPGVQPNYEDIIEHLNS